MRQARPTRRLERAHSGPRRAHLRRRASSDAWSGRSGACRFTLRSVGRAASDRSRVVVDWHQDRSMTDARDGQLEARARQSLGESGGAIYEAAMSALRRRGAGGAAVDVGCGAGRLYSRLAGIADTYVGVDAVRYDGFPATAAFVPAV